MLLFPNCKINLGLQILRKRADGFHDLETCFYPIALTDALEVITNPAAEQDVVFSSSGIILDIAPSENICVKAYQLLKQDFPQLPSVKMHLHKHIPSGAGLGGGSADAAFTLLLLNKKFLLQLSQKKLMEYAAQLGSDCPFFILNQPAFATGRGEQLEPILLDLSEYDLVLVNPGIHVPTGWAFNQLKPFDKRVSVRSIINQPIETWKNSLANDFEAPIFLKYPTIGQIKEKLYEAGAVYASMSGSGSTVFGLFPRNMIPALTFPDSYFVKKLPLRKY